MVLHSLKPCIQLAKAIASANLRTLEAISVLTESDALYLGSLLVLIDKLQVNTSFCKFILELLPAICDFQCIIDGIVNLVFGTLRIAQFASVSIALVRSVGQSIPTWILEPWSPAHYACNHSCLIRVCPRY